ncbi:MAG: hypothetical protein DWQ19_11170 [Crenarchaeota archaeon]|nr:MAG: hypothetical protein DWQ19_11170 [Thermoproteota archaeon]
MTLDELTLEEQKLLEKLPDPDAETQGQYSWDEELQREVMGLLLNDKYFVTQSQGLVKPSYFTNECHKITSGIIFNYFEKYKNLPNKTQLVYELKEKLKNREPKHTVYYLSELNTVCDYYVPGIEHRDYYLDKITNFAKGMAMKSAFNESLKEFQKAPEAEETWVKIEGLLRDAMNVDRNFDMGLDYFREFEDRYQRQAEKKQADEVFVTGFPAIDESLSNGGLARGEIGSVVGISGSGKSIMLVNIAVANIHRDKKVLYISLEIDADKCAERFDAQFANPNPFGEESNQVTIKNLSDNKETLFNALREYVSDKDDERLLVIRQFPAGQLDLSTLRAYFSQLKLLGFLPDVVIIDYVGEMKDYPGMPTWESRQKIVRDLRGFAVEEQVVVFTAMQPDSRSREAINSGGIIDDENLAESKGQVRPLDALWSINQLKTERECNLARLFVIKHRDGKSRFDVHVEFDYNTLKMRQISENKYVKIHKEYQNKKEETVTAALKETEEQKVNRIVGGNKFQDDVGYLND